MTDHRLATGPNAFVRSAGWLFMQVTRKKENS
jgi:hypothetical protein